MSTTALSLEIANQLGISPSEELVGYLTNKLNEFGVQSLSDIQEDYVPDEKTINTAEPRERRALVNVRTGQEIPSKWGGQNVGFTTMLATDGYGTTIDISPGKITKNFDQRTKLARQIVDRMDWDTAKGPAWKALGTNDLGIPNLAYEVVDSILANVKNKTPNKTITDLSELSPEDIQATRIYESFAGDGKTAVELEYGPNGPKFSSWRGSTGVWEGLGPIGQAAAMIAAAYFLGPTVMKAFGTAGAASGAAAVAGVEGAAAQAAFAASGAAATAGGITAAVTAALPAELVAVGQKLVTAYSAVAPYIQAANSIYQLSKGNLMGAVVSGLGAAGGFGVPGAATAAQTLNSAFAIAQGNPIPALTQFMGTDAGKGLMTTKIAGNFTLADALTGAEFIQAAENKNVSGMLSAASKLTKNGDLSVASQAARVVEVINDPKSDAVKIAQTVGNFADTIFKLSEQGSKTSKQITNAQNANNALRGSPLTPQQIESHVANGGNPEDLVGRQTGLRQEQVRRGRARRLQHYLQ